jgi:5,10-methylene-tetrahydrofolate dehydrogenase/methenyl tetrahydrofolate cyclohydrolase
MSLMQLTVVLSAVFSVPSTEPSATIIDGKAIAQQVRQEIAAEVSKMKESVGKVPGLAVILVGTRKDSETYVRSKKKACEEVGIDSYGVNLPEDTTQDEVLNFVKKFNDDPAVHGILVQLPLPKVCSLLGVLGLHACTKAS